MKFIDDKSNLLYTSYQTLAMISGTDKSKKYGKANRLYGWKKSQFQEYVEDTKKELEQLEDTEEIIQKLNSIKKNSELLQYLEREYENYLSRLQLRDEEFERIIATFDEKTKKAFKIFKEELPDFRVLNRTDKVCISVSEAESYCVNLVLESSCDVPEFGETSVRDFELTKNESGFVLEMLLDDMEAQQRHTIKISFTRAYTEMKLFNYARGSIFWDANPWILLADILYELKLKSNWGLEFLNDKERELLVLSDFQPISDFLIQTKGGYGLSEETFQLLRSYVKASENTSLLPFLEKLYCATEEKKQKQLCQKLKNRLNKPDSKNLWRLMMEDLTEASKEYPSKSECYCDAKKMKYIRNCIEKCLKQYGMAGTYPDFFMREKDESGKAIISYIQAKEYYMEVSFAIGTAAFEKTCEKIYEYKDFYDILFAYKNGKKKGVKISVSLADMLLSDGETNKAIQKICAIASKAAKLQKLDKEEIWT